MTTHDAYLARPITGFADDGSPTRCYDGGADVGYARFHDMLCNLSDGACRDAERDPGTMLVEANADLDREADRFSTIEGVTPPRPELDDEEELEAPAVGDEVVVAYPEGDADTGTLESLGEWRATVRRSDGVLIHTVPEAVGLLARAPSRSQATPRWLQRLTARDETALSPHLI